MPEHSPEPWEPWRCEFHAADAAGPGGEDLEFCGFRVGDGGVLDYSRDVYECRNAVDKADARRIVACINACRNIPTLGLERIVEEHGSILEDVRNYGCVAGWPLLYEVSQDV